MRYTFRCIGTECDHTEIVHASIHDGPPEPFLCTWCGDALVHDIAADLKTVTIDTSGCRDHDFIPEQHRVPISDGVGISAEKREQLYHRELQQKRAQLREGNRGSVKQTHSIPAELYHGKIRETKDPHYWKDPKNLKRHKSTEVAS